MSGDLTGARLKVNRANKHVLDLEASIRAFGKTNPYYAVAKDNPKTGKREWRIRVEREIPPTLAAITGDAIHNLRSALDHLMGQLVIANGGQPDSKTEFPIGRDETHYKSMRARKTKGASKAALDLIDGLKPYKGGNDALWRIHQLDVVDKHRLLLTVLSAHSNVVINAMAIMREAFPDDQVVAGFPDVVIALTESTREVVTDGMLFFSAPLGEDHHDVKATVEISIDEPGVIEREPILPTLNQLGSFVNETITLFEPLITSP